MFIVEEIRENLLFGVSALLVAESDMLLEKQRLVPRTVMAPAPNIILHRLRVAKGERFRLRYRKSRAPSVGQRIPLEAVARKGGLRDRWVRIGLF